jgi:hypothetical protein
MARIMAPLQLTIKKKSAHCQDDNAHKWVQHKRNNTRQTEALRADPR